MPSPPFFRNTFPCSVLNYSAWDSVGQCWVSVWFLSYSPDSDDLSAHSLGCALFVHFHSFFSSPRQDTFAFCSSYPDLDSDPAISSAEIHPSRVPIRRFWLIWTGKGHVGRFPPHLGFSLSAFLGSSSRGLKRTAKLYLIFDSGRM